MEKEPRSSEIPASEETIKKTLDAWWNFLHQRRGVGKYRQDYAGIWPKLVIEPTSTLQPSSIRYTEYQVKEFSNVNSQTPKTSDKKISIEGITYPNVTKLIDQDLDFEQSSYECHSSLDLDKICDYLSTTGGSYPERFFMHVSYTQDNPPVSEEILTFSDEEKKFHSIKLTSLQLNSKSSNELLATKYVLNQATETDMQTIISLLQKASAGAKKDLDISFARYTKHALSAINVQNLLQKSREN